MRTKSLAVVLACLALPAQAQNLQTDEVNVSTLQALGGPTHVAQARELILRAGYTEVDDPRRQDDGTWKAVAIREERRVTVTINRDGNVKP
jgi:hypothetical protein